MFKTKDGSAMGKPPTLLDDYRQSLLSKLDGKRLTIENDEFSMAECADVLRLLTIDVALDCPDDDYLQRITDCGGRWWNSGPPGGQLSWILADSRGELPEDQVLSNLRTRARRELREFVARVICLLQAVK